MSTLWEKNNYTADISYLTNIFITEYDISKCNINVLYTKGVIDKKTYDYLYESERMIRQVYVGKLIKEDNQVYKILNAGIIEAKHMLFDENGIEDRDVLSIKNDAVFLINKKVKNRKFGLIEFLPKGLYTSFYKLPNLELYYYYNSVNKKEYIDTKGISQENLAKHQLFFLEMLKDVFYFVQTEGPEVALRVIKDYYFEYINLLLPIEHYRRFDTVSQYHLKVNTIINTGFNLDDATDAHKPMLDITYNLNILMQINKYITDMYFNKHK